MGKARFRTQVRKTFAAMDAEVKGGPGLLDVLQITDQLDPWLKSVDVYLSALKPPPQTTSASSTSIVSEPRES
jgi:hypothetical protein